MIRSVPIANIRSRLKNKYATRKDPARSLGRNTDLTIGITMILRTRKDLAQIMDISTGMTTYITVIHMARTVLQRNRIYLRLWLVILINPTSRK